MPHMPAAAQPLAQGTILHYRNCSITIRKDDALVVRGKDRFHIPAWSRFFLAEKKLVFLHKSKNAELRVYTLSNL